MQQNNNDKNPIDQVVGSLFATLFQDPATSKDNLDDLAKSFKHGFGKINESFKRLNESCVSNGGSIQTPTNTNPILDKFEELISPKTSQGLNKKPSPLNNLSTDAEVIKNYHQQIKTQPDNIYYVGLTGATVKLTLENDGIIANDVVSQQKYQLDTYTLRTLLAVNHTHYFLLKMLYPSLPIVNPEQIESFNYPKVNQITDEYAKRNNYPSMMCFVSNTTCDKDGIMKQGDIQRIIGKTNKRYMSDTGKTYQYALVLDSQSILKN